MHSAAHVIGQIPSSITSIVGGRTEEEVKHNNISVLNGIKTKIYLDGVLDRASLLALINGIADLTNEPRQVFEIRSNNIKQLTEEELKRVTDKNWEVK